MCATCIYRTGELTRNVIRHPCHEHSTPHDDGLNILCAGSCKASEARLIETIPPNASNWCAEKSGAAVRNRLERGYGKAKYSDSVRVWKISKSIMKLAN